MLRVSIKQSVIDILIHRKLQTYFHKYKETKDSNISTIFFS